MQAKLYVANSLHPCYPGHDLLSKPRPPRAMKATTADAFKSHVTQGSTDPLQDILKTIHTESVASTIQSYRPNRVLNASPPTDDVMARERKANLTRRVRTQLSQLRSGFSTALNSYKARLTSCFHNVIDICPDCLGASHTTRHLFDCPARPTQLTAEDLWLHHDMAVEVLRLT